MGHVTSAHCLPGRTHPVCLSQIGALSACSFPVADECWSAVGGRLARRPCRPSVESPSMRRHNVKDGTWPGANGIPPSGPLFLGSRFAALDAHNPPAAEGLGQQEEQGSRADPGGSFLAGGPAAIEPGNRRPFLSVPGGERRVRLPLGKGHRRGGGGEPGQTANRTRVMRCPGAQLKCSCQLQGGRASCQ
jgi:hypothetical protein